MEATTRATSLDVFSEGCVGVPPQSCRLGTLEHGCTLNEADCARAKGEGNADNMHQIARALLAVGSLTYL
jgi:hypothetical protein